MVLKRTGGINLAVFAIEIGLKEFDFDKGDDINDVIDYLVEIYDFNREEIKDYDLEDIEEALEKIRVQYKEYDDE